MSTFQSIHDCCQTTTTCSRGHLFYSVERVKSRKWLNVGGHLDFQRNISFQGHFWTHFSKRFFDFYFSLWVHQLIGLPKVLLYVYSCKRQCQLIMTVSRFFYGIISSWECFWQPNDLCQFFWDSCEKLWEKTFFWFFSCLIETFFVVQMISVVRNKIFG